MMMRDASFEAIFCGATDLETPVLLSELTAHRAWASMILIICCSSILMWFGRLELLTAIIVFTLTVGDVREIRR